MTSNDLAIPYRIHFDLPSACKSSHLSFSGIYNKKIRNKNITKIITRCWIPTYDT